MTRILRTIAVADRDGDHVGAHLDQYGSAWLEIGPHRAVFAVLAADATAEDLARDRRALRDLHAFLGQVLALDPSEAGVDDPHLALPVPGCAPRAA